MKLINCDLGECLTPDPDSQIMPLIDMANIACGGHVGDEHSMVKTVLLAKQHNVRIGVHPSYPDKDNFGRISHQYQESYLFDLLIQQISAFNEICQAYDAELCYVKPHGALYHDMMDKPAVFAVIKDVMKAFAPNLQLVIQAGLWPQCEDSELELIHEAFADRGYRENQLVPRSEDGALLKHARAIVDQYQQFCSDPPFKIDTVCFHSDHVPSLEALNRIKGN